MPVEYQFEEGEILLQPYSDKVGPFTFDLSPQLAIGDSINSVTVKAYRRGTDISTDLIDTPAPSLAGDVVTVYFKWPGTTKTGKSKLTFEYTTAAQMKDEADFWCVLAKDV